MSNRTTALTLTFLLVVLGVAGWLWYRGQTNSELPALSDDLITASDGNADSDDGIPLDVDIEATTLAGVGEFADAQGAATRSYFEGIFVHGVNAALPDPSVGQFYEGWLMDGEQFFSTGHLVKSRDEYLLDYTATTNYDTYRTIVITRESTDDGQMETRVLEGTFPTP